MPYTTEHNMRRRASSLPDTRVVVPEDRWVFAPTAQQQEQWATWVAEAKAPLTIWMATALSRQEYYKELEARSHAPMQGYVESAQVKKAQAKALHRRNSLQFESGQKVHESEWEIAMKKSQAEKKAKELCDQAQAMAKHGPRAQNMLKFQAAMVQQEAEYECQRIRSNSDFEAKQLRVQAARAVEEVAAVAEKAWKNVKNCPGQQEGVVKGTVIRTLGTRRGSIIVDEEEQKCE